MPRLLNRAKRWAAVVKSHRRLVFYLKLLFSLALLAALLIAVDLGELARNLIFVNPWILAVVFLIRFNQFLLTSLKWKYCLHLFDLKYSFTRLFEIVCIGFFYNNFFPSSIGGDSYRLYRTTPKKQFFLHSLSALLVDRVSGFFVLILLGVLSCTVYLLTHYSEAVRNMAVAGVILLSAGLVIALGFRPWLMRLFWKYIEKKHSNAASVLRQYKPFANRKLVSKLLTIAIIFHISAFIAVKLLYLALDVEITIVQAGIVVAMAVMVSTLPISFNGIGIVETAFVFTSMEMGVSYDGAVLAAVIQRLLTVSISICCGLLYVGESYRGRRE